MASTSTVPDRPLRDALALVAARPLLPTSYMALLLGQDAGEVELRLLAAARAGLVRQVVDGCCGRSRFAITTLGERLARESCA